MRQILFIKWFITSLCVIGLLYMGCKSTEPMTYNHSDRIEFGSFGGFAGSYKSYTFVPDGQVWRQSKHQADYEVMASVDQSIIRQAIENIRQLSKSKYQINEPGNMTYFLRLHEEGQEPYELLWGGADPDPRARIIYKSLIALVKPDQPIR